MTAFSRVSLLVLVLAACNAPPQEEAEGPALPAGTVELTDAQLADAEITLDTVRISEVAVPIAIPGMVDAADPGSAVAGSIVGGRVEQVYVIPGARVAAGDILVRIHSHELADARRDLVAAEANLAAVRQAYERSARLLEAKAVAREEVEAREAAWLAAKGELARAAEIVDHLHPVGEDVTVRAPVSGVVFNVTTRIGEAVLPGQPLVELGNDRTLWITAWVPELAVPSLQPAATARVTLAAFPGDTFAARLVRLGGRIDPMRRAVDVRAALTSPPQGLRPGMFATLHLETGPRQPRAVLPEEAVQRGEGGAAVFVADAPNRFRRVPVADAVMLPDGMVAVTGLQDGMVVVGRGAYTVRALLEADPEAGHAH
jgi:cobalt-zinc-cadmium efflux system membrane fusion protein